MNILNAGCLGKTMKEKIRGAQIGTSGGFIDETKCMPSRDASAQLCTFKALAHAFLALMLFYFPVEKVKHTPLPQQLVTCTVGGGEGRKCLRRATVRLPNTATFRELLESARKQRYAALDFEGPVYGRDGELETTLRDAWVRNDCKVDGTLHIGLAVAVSFILESRATLSFIMGPADTIGGVKQVSEIRIA